MSSPSDYLVTSLPLLTADISATLSGMYAGLIPSNDDPSNPMKYFFSFFPAAPSVKSSDLVIWMNGGPGCSSLEGLYTEHGPIMFASNGTLYANPYGWHNLANVLYVEQPIGTGFSAVYNLNDTFDEYGLAQYFNTFLTNFYSIFNETKSYDLYLTGESYAGTYIPYIATNLIKAEFPLKGIAMGNPWFNPPNDPPEMQLELFESVPNFFTGPTASAVIAEAETIIAQCNSTSTADWGSLPYQCYIENLFADWYYETHDEYGVNNTCYDPYNIAFAYPCNNTFDDHGFLAEEAMTDFLNRPDVQAALHIDDLPTNFTWNECSNVPLNDSLNPNSNTLLDGIVAAGVKVLIFDGDYDSVCDYLIVEATLANTTWGGGVGFTSASSDWVVGTSKDGKVWEDRGLKYIRVFGVGHMVAADDPVKGFAILETLLGESTATTVATTAATTAVTAIGSSANQVVLSFAAMLVMLALLV
ncbi:hypothetical protein HDU84_008669 [Entophlyctis sp. JEL0112]|nr:hypothetical protein HDU84_008669 [Entophlyctis sp. JEL0112]